MSAASSSLRTFPPPHELTDPEALRAERDRLLIENARLRDELSRLRDAAAHREPPRTSERAARTPTREMSFGPSSSGPSSLSPVSAAAPLFALDETPTGGPRAAEPSQNAGIDFGTVSRLTPDELDRLPYGLICLDAQGRVVQYNDTESRLARLPKERVIGRNFFADVAPCTRVREFEGQFYDLVRDPSRVRVRSFDFVFRFRHSEQHVTIVITPARTRGLYNMALLRRAVTTPER